MWVPHDVRDQIVDFVRRWSEKTGIGAGRFIEWFGIQASKFYDWRDRYGQVNEHNGWVPRDFWLEQWEKQAIIDFHLNRFGTSQHCLQSANKAMQSGADEEIILACFLHDTVHALVKTDHGWWGAQMYAPYVPERTAWAIRYHQALRFYTDKDAGYEYPDLYRHLFGVDYVPPPHIDAAYKYARKHKWYGAARAVTVNDLYAFDSSKVMKIDPFLDIVGRHFKNPEEGLGNDNSPSAHMFRAMSTPDVPL